MLLASELAASSGAPTGFRFRVQGVNTVGQRAGSQLGCSYPPDGDRVQGLRTSGTRPGRAQAAYFCRSMTEKSSAGLTRTYPPDGDGAGDGEQVAKHILYHEGGRELEHPLIGGTEGVMSLTMLQGEGKSTGV